MFEGRIAKKKKPWREGSYQGMTFSRAAPEPLARFAFRRCAQGRVARMHILAFEYVHILSFERMLGEVWKPRPSGRGKEDNNYSGL